MFPCNLVKLMTSFTHREIFSIVNGLYFIRNDDDVAVYKSCCKILIDMIFICESLDSMISGCIMKRDKQMEVDIIHGVNVNVYERADMNHFAMLQMTSLIKVFG